MNDIQNYMNEWDKFKRAKEELYEIVNTINSVQLALKGRHPNFTFSKLPIGRATPLSAILPGMKTIDYKHWPDVNKFQDALSLYHNSLQNLRALRSKLGEMGNDLPNPDA